jgi:hypothetical protein
MEMRLVGLFALGEEAICGNGYKVTQSRQAERKAAERETGGHRQEAGIVGAE